MIVSWRQMIGALNNAAGHVCRSPQPAAPAANTALPWFSPNALLICALHASIYPLLCTAQYCLCTLLLRRWDVFCPSMGSSLIPPPLHGTVTLLLKRLQCKGSLGNYKSNQILHSLINWVTLSFKIVQPSGSCFCRWFKVVNLKPRKL